MRIHQLDQDASDAWAEWQAAKAAAQRHDKRAKRAKAIFVKAFGDRKTARLENGKIVDKIEVERDGYKVEPFVRTTYEIRA